MHNSMAITDGNLYFQLMKNSNGPFPWHVQQLQIVLRVVCHSHSISRRINVDQCINHSFLEVYRAPKFVKKRLKTRQHCKLFWTCLNPIFMLLNYNGYHRKRGILISFYWQSLLIWIKWLHHCLCLEQLWLPRNAGSVFWALEYHPTLWACKSTGNNPQAPKLLPGIFYCISLGQKVYMRQQCCASLQIFQLYFQEQELWNWTSKSHQRAPSFE